MARRTRIEQETIINYNEEEKTASIFTFNVALKHKLVKLAEKLPDECKEADTVCPESAVEYIVPKRWIKVSPPKRISEEQKAASAERMKAYHESQKGNNADA